MRIYSACFLLFLFVCIAFCTPLLILQQRTFCPCTHLPLYSIPLISIPLVFQLASISPSGFSACTDQSSPNVFSTSTHQCSIIPSVCNHHDPSYVPMCFLLQQNHVCRCHYMLANNAYNETSAPIHAGPPTRQRITLSFPYISSPLLSHVFSSLLS